MARDKHAEADPTSKSYLHVLLFPIKKSAITFFRALRLLAGWLSGHQRMTFQCLTNAYTCFYKERTLPFSSCTNGPMPPTGPSSASGQCYRALGTKFRHLCQFYSSTGTAKFRVREVTQVLEVAWSMSCTLCPILVFELWLGL